MAQVICGVDVASSSLQVRIGIRGAEASFGNDPEGVGLLAGFCREHQVTLVAMEATGGYERHACALLGGEGIDVAVLNPRAVRQFASGMGRLEKTDRIDAGMIAWYTEVRGVKPNAPASAAQHQLRALVTRLRQLTGLRTAQRNQRRLVEDAEVQAGFSDLLAVIKKQIDQLSRQVAALIDSDPLWKQLDASFRTVRGVADRTVARIMAEMPEIGTLPNKTVSKLAGLAPLANDSGKHRGHRPVRGGRSSVREILFVVASVAGRYEPDFIAFKQRLAAQGKPPKVIRIALAHKLLVRLNAKAREIRNLQTA